MCVCVCLCVCMYVCAAHVHVCVCVCICVCVCDCVFIHISLYVYHLYTGDGVSLFQFNEYVASKIPDKWRRVGVGLGLSQALINAIDDRYRGEFFKCFSDVFKYWQNDSTPEQPANWATLISVLRSSTVGEKVLAEHIQSTLMGDTH